jgi:octaprenyl-diphosphate synthase
MDEYFEIIRKKTAALIAACTASGARASTDSQDAVEKMKSFGYNLGIAFQIKDDLFDYVKNGKIGKPTANDIKEKKMTLPLIYSLGQCSPAEKKYIIKIIRKQNKNSKKVLEVLEFVKKHGGLEYAETKMNEYKNLALEIIREFPENDSRNAMIDLVEFTVTRKK